MSRNLERSSQAATPVTPVTALDNVLDRMTALATDVALLHELILSSRALELQRRDELTSQLSALALTVAEAYQRVLRCHELFTGASTSSDNEPTRDA